eukprot:PITA_16342
MIFWRAKLVVREAEITPERAETRKGCCSLCGVLKCLTHGDELCRLLWVSCKRYEQFRGQRKDLEQQVWCVCVNVVTRFRSVHGAASASVAARYNSAKHWDSKVQQCETLGQHVWQQGTAVLNIGTSSVTAWCNNGTWGGNDTWCTLSENGKFLLAARKFRRATSTEYIISLNADDMSRGSNTYVGKLRSNFLGTKFTIYDSQPPHSGAIASTSRAGRRVGAKQVSPRVPAGSYNIAHIGYELNVLGTRGPRRMQCIMHSIPASAVQPGGSAPTPVEPSVASLDQSLASCPTFGSKSCILESSSISEPLTGSNLKDEPLVLKNKAPRWHEQLQCWCLNFKGRVTVASVKNFQLVAAPEPNPSVSQNDCDKVILQFGKVGKDMFTMDYRYPLSAFQAFAICLSSFDTKLACE